MSKLTINRGFPIYGNFDPLRFTPPLADELFFVTLFARQADPTGVAALTVERRVSTNGVVTVLPALNVPAASPLEFSVFSQIPVQGTNSYIEVEMTAGSGIVYGFVENGAPTGLQPNAPLSGEDEGPPQSIILPVEARALQPEVLVHTLDPRYEDLITLDMALGDDIDLRFYDGSFSVGVANFLAVFVHGAADANPPVFGRYMSAQPMRGPGKITMVTRNVSGLPCTVFGTVIRNAA